MLIFSVYSNYYNLSCHFLYISSVFSYLILCATLYTFISISDLVHHFIYISTVSFLLSHLIHHLIYIDSVYSFFSNLIQHFIYVSSFYFHYHLSSLMRHNIIFFCLFLSLSSHTVWIHPYLLPLSRPSSLLLGLSATSMSVITSRMFYTKQA